MSSPKSATLEIACAGCGGINRFAQPYAYHAGFADQGFLYDDDGLSTLVWSLYDPALEPFFQRHTRWMTVPSEQRRFEEKLPLSPRGRQWRFNNSARCVHCGIPVSGPMQDMIYYLVYPQSVLTDCESKLQLSSYLLPQCLTIQQNQGEQGAPSNR